MALKLVRAKSRDLETENSRQGAILLTGAANPGITALLHNSLCARHFAI